MVCENCGKEHLCNYGSGRFCSKECARSYSTKNINYKETKIAKCINCGKEIIIYDSKIDGIKPIMCDTYPEEKFQIKNIDENFEIVLKYNYYSKDYKTNKFVDCFIEIKNRDMKKAKQLYEG